MKNTKKLIAFAILAAAGGVVIIYLAFFNNFLRENKTSLENELSRNTESFIVSTQKLNNDISNLNTDIENLNEILVSTEDELATTTAQRNDFEEKYLAEKNKIDGLNSQLSDIKGTVDTLEKLKQIDPELLKKYSKVYFLNENYSPATFTKIDPNYVFNPNEDYLIYAKIWPFLNILITTAKADGVDIEIASAYRSFSEQSGLKSSYKMIYGAGANKFSADQGYSEHQLGTTVDFTTSQVGSTFSGFEKTATYRWLLDNAYTYGFVLSYPQNNKYYQFEPWHWRFVGRALAQKLHDEGKNFYDLDQREIDKYLISFFD